ncbi:CPBP family intramembrane glutamic endopeptidase [Thermomonospora cellulosilytica]|uniref:Membrane protease YdiL (CAAX protease family) n=1 Tax=Thermomonospora cellulosilytica TaxID=1411118 RepID=A0A7W3N1K3_9ACTN|nr:CPBP family intramembrane glutamic endopeptidase [Thermomonospora cellulosilytica]MBA9005823.1 membrane protease YdiL (CAAX protease family) [Thermomonospora cellulosilytica]
MPVASHVAVAAVVIVLTLVNVLNNRLLPAAYVLTSIVATAVLLVLLRSAGVGWDQAGLGRDAVRRGVTWGLLLVVVVAVCYLVCALLPATRDLFLDRRVGSADPGRLAFEVLVRIPVGTVLLEEVAFRGVLYALVRSEHGVAWATVVSSGLFGLWHVVPASGISTVNPFFTRIFGAGPLGAVIATAVAVAAMALAGAVLCELQRRSGSLLAPAALHWAANGLGFITAYLVINFR